MIDNCSSHAKEWTVHRDVQKTNLGFEFHLGDSNRQWNYIVTQKFKDNINGRLKEQVEYS